MWDNSAFVSHQTILVLDFGSQYTQLIARRLRELSVYSEIVPFNTPVEKLREKSPVGIILSGGPKSVSEAGAPKCAVFAMSCLFRPLGALLIGARADRIGRRSVLAATIAADGRRHRRHRPVTAVVGDRGGRAALPVGVAGRAGVLLRREIGVSVAYLMEFSPGRSTGRYGGWYPQPRSASASPRGSGRPPSSPRSLIPAALQSWGWRLPFLLALPLGPVGLYIVGG